MEITTSIYQEMGKKIAEEALDGYIYKGKTLREWIDILAETKSEYEHDHEVVKAYNDGQAYILDKIREEIEQLPTKTRTNWDGCCPDINYPEIEYVDVSKKQLLEIIDKYKTESEDNE